MMFMYVLAAVNLAMAIGIAAGFARKAPIRREAKIVCYAVVAVLYIMSVSYMPLRRGGYFSGYLEDIFASSVAIIFIFFIAVLIGDWIVRALKNPRSKNIARLSIPIAAIVYLSYGFFSAFTAPNVKRVFVEMDGIVKPVTIAHLTDLHLGNGKLLNERFAKNIADQVNDLRPDMVVITGDLIDAPIARVETALAEIAKIQSKYGIFFATGNHEYFYNPDEAFERLEQLGVITLRNDSRVISGEFGEIAIAGVYDLVGRRYGRLKPDPKKALENIPAETPTIALAHQPKAAFEFKPNSFDLMFAGHTHGGQMFPFTIFVAFAQPYVAGLYTRDGDDRGKIYVSRGVGYWGPPFRMFAPNEIALIALLPKENV
ncbi:MAG: metallophosphoesterase [Helicobacteraceae bacterium]|jgi:predicted MPP superfamily phosphohydrolase|nr:metallophosphoesterase [Helicobacteraceae bacterium]